MGASFNGIAAVLAAEARFQVSHQQRISRGSQFLEQSTKEVIMMITREGPLHGFKVLDACQLAVGPLAASWLGQLGAEVIKVESPTGDPLRLLEPYMSSVGTYYTAVNLNKSRIVLDLKATEGREKFMQLARGADVFLQNFRPGVVERLGIDFGSLHSLNPELVYVSCSGYGSVGPRRGEGGADPFIRMFTGFDSVNGREGERPERFRNRGHIDHVTSSCVLQAALAALYSREMTGRGQHVQTSMLEATVAYEMPLVAEFMASGREPRPLGSNGRWGAPDGAFKAADGYVAITAVSQEHWTRLCAFLGRSVDPALRNSDIRERLSQRQRIAALISSRIADLSAVEVVDELSSLGVPVAKFSSLSQVEDNPQVHANKMIRPIEHPWGIVKLPAPQWAFEKSPAYLAPAPANDDAQINGWSAGEERRFTRPGSLVGGAIDGGLLAGVEIVEIADGSLAVSYAGMQLTQLGATVVKVEPTGLDSLRAWGTPGNSEGSTSGLFEELNRGKEIFGQNEIVTDAVLRSRLERADAVITDGSLALDLEMACKVVCHMSTYGASGPWASRQGSEITVQATVGAWEYLGATNGEPLRLGVDAADAACGVAGVQAVLAGLLARSRVGGQRVSVSGLSSMLALSCHLVAAHSSPSLTGGWHLDAEKRGPEYPLEAADGDIDFSLPDAFSFQEFYRIIGVPEDIAGRTEFNDKFLMVVNWEEYSSIIGSYIRRHTSYELKDWVNAFGGLAVKGNTIASLMEDSQLAALNLLRWDDDMPSGRVVGLNGPWRFGVSQGDSEAKV
jgi:CoA:oxalate CoA-transferase